MASCLLDSVDGSFQDGPSYETRVVVGSASRGLLEAALRYDAEEIARPVRTLPGPTPERYAPNMPCHEGAQKEQR